MQTVVYLYNNNAKHLKRKHYENYKIRLNGTFKKRNKNIM